MSKAAEVYLQSANNKLGTAIEALEQVDAIVKSGELTDEALEWTRRLDFDRLYAEGRERGVIPAHSDQWARLSMINRDGDVLSITSHVINDIEEIRALIGRVIEKSEHVVRNRAGVPLDALTLQAAILDAAAFAQMVAYVNMLEPLDPKWRLAGARSGGRVEITA